MLSRGAVVVSIAALATTPSTRALDLPNIHIPRPHISTGQSPYRASDFVGGVSPGCSPQNLSRYPSGWPATLDWGIYWFGQDGEFKKAQPRQQASMLDPTSWFDNGDGYPNATERWKHEFFDPSRNTLIYFHGWSGTGAWSTKQCHRITATCDQDLCPNGGGQNLAEAWLQQGWNVGFFYWDQFADEPCMRDAEQKIWFDRRGNGLRWASYDPNNVTQTQVEWRQYQGPEGSVADLCVTAVKEALGDFYAGDTVRFVGRSIGSQLAVACAAKLHEDKHVAAPQRMALLDPFFTQKEFSFLGTNIRCGQVTSDTGVGEFTQEATANYVKMLWKRNRVATEVYTSADDDTSGSDADGQAAHNLQNYAVRVAYKPRWCAQQPMDRLQCHHRAVFPIYFLSKAIPPRPLATTSISHRRLEAPTQQFRCKVPSASCSDAELRALMEQHADMAEQREQDGLPEVRQIWEQVAGMETFMLDDDSFSVVNSELLVSITPNPDIEAEVAHGAPMQERDWSVHRSTKVGPEAGLSRAQFDRGTKIFAWIVLIPFAAFVTYRLASLGRERFGSSFASRNNSEDDEDEDSDSPSGKSRSRDSSQPKDGKALLGP